MKTLSILQGRCRFSRRTQCLHGKECWVGVGGVMERRGGVGAGQCWVCKDGGENTHTHAQNHAHNTKNSFSYVLYVLIFSNVHSPPCSIPNLSPPLPPLLPRVDSGLLSSFFSYNWLMSSDQLQTTKPSPPTDGKVLRTALKCVEVRLRVCLCPLKGAVFNLSNCFLYSKHMPKNFQSEMS